jgi:hypothetical protein
MSHADFSINDIINQRKKLQQTSGAVTYRRILDFYNSPTHLLALTAIES